ncbi:MAG TPA: STAS domain-containing protein [Miltoncostaeaceae bacterium]|nr:STAS domain-containing protein [Miltoncostaeaceae bacterium]
MPELVIEPTWDGAGQARLRIAGDLDLAAAREVGAALSLLEANDPAELTLDLRDVEFIDSVGLRVIMEAEQRRRRSDRELAVVAREDGPVGRLLSLTLLTQRVRMVERLEELHAAGTGAPGG